MLDGTVFAHAATTTAEDLRLYATHNGEPGREVPFAITESAPQPTEAETATVRNAAVRNGHLFFDLAMPPRSYTEVELGLNAQNFLGFARVSGIDGAQRTPTPLGASSIFDLSGEGLPRSTILPIAQSRLPVLHIDLRLTDPQGHALANLSPAMITGAMVPPSGAGETLYNTVASTTAILSKALSSSATLRVPAHVPVERVQFVLDPAFTQDFLRDVTISASPITDNAALATAPAAESIPSRIFRVTRRTMPAAMPPIDTHHLFVDVALGSNLRSPARVTVGVYNSYQRPLPIQRIELQMRQRKICFNAAPTTSFVLRYGDAALHAPSYPYARGFQPAAAPIQAVLGPELANPHFVLRPAEASYRRRNPSIMWMMLLAVLTIAGVVLLQLIRYREEETR